MENQSGAGIILFLNQGAIRGLTTAAGLWTVAAIGLATGGGMYFAAGATTVRADHPLGPAALGAALCQAVQATHLAGHHRPGISNVELPQRITNNNAYPLQNCIMDKVEDGSVYQLKFDSIDADQIMRIMDELKNEPAIKEIHWQQ